MRSIYLLVVALLLTTATYRADAASTGTVEDTLQNTYFAATKSGDVALFKEAFTEDATIHGYYDGDPFNGPIQILYDDLRDAGPSPLATGKVAYLDVQDNIAMAVFEERNAHETDDHNGPGVERNFTDMDTFMKVGDKWLIVGKVFFTFPQGQSERSNANDDKAGVQATLTKYLGAVKNGDMALLKTAFSADGMVHGNYEGESYEGPAEKLFQHVNGHPANIEGTITPNIQIQDTIAIARIEASKNKNDVNQRQDYTEMFALIKTGDHWEIVSEMIYAYPKIKEGEVDVIGGKIHYKIFYNDATANQTPVVLLNGGPGAPLNYFLPLKKLADARPVVLYDQLGSGLSSAIDPAYPDHSVLWTIDRYVDELDRLVTHLGYQQVDLLGHSWGSTLAFEYYLKHPQSVGKLILEGSFFSGRLWDADAAYWLSQMPEPQKTTLTQCSQNNNWDSQPCQDADMFYNQQHLNRQEAWPQDFWDSFNNIGEEVYLAMNGPNEFQGSGTLGHYEAMDKLPLILVPTLFIAGEYDEARPETTRDYASRVGGAQVVIFDGASHTSHLERTAEFLEIVGNFLQ